MNAKDLAEYCASPPDPEEGQEKAITPDIGIVGENLFFSFLPESPDECVVIYDTGGWPPRPHLPRKDPTFQFRFRAGDYDTVQTLIKKFSDWFVPGGIPKKCFQIGEEFIHLVQPMQAAAFCLGYDENQRIEFTWNFTFIIH